MKINILIATLFKNLEPGSFNNFTVKRKGCYTGTRIVQFFEEHESAEADSVYIASGTVKQGNLRRVSFLFNEENLFKIIFAKGPRKEDGDDAKTINLLESPLSDEQVIAKVKDFLAGK